MKLKKFIGSITRNPPVSAYRRSPWAIANRDAWQSQCSIIPKSVDFIEDAIKKQWQAAPSAASSAQARGIWLVKSALPSKWARTAWTSAKPSTHIRHWANPSVWRRKSRMGIVRMCRRRRKNKLLTDQTKCHRVILVAFFKINDRRCD